LTSGLHRAAFFIAMPCANAVLATANVNATADTQYNEVLGILIMEFLLCAARNAGNVIAGFNNVGCNEKRRRDL
jgi:hypothetical protein